MSEPACRKAYPSDVSDEEWAFVAPYLTLMAEDAPQRQHPMREVSHYDDVQQSIVRRDVDAASPSMMEDLG